MAIRKTREECREAYPSGPVPDTDVQRANPYIVQKGDTLYSIAQSNGVSQKDLAEWNNIQDPGHSRLASNFIFRHRDQGATIPFQPLRSPACLVQSLVTGTPRSGNAGSRR